MSQVSVNTNYGALLALQNLNSTNSELETTQNRINTGLKVATAKDNGATFAIAQLMRGSVSGYGVAGDTLDKAISALDVTLTAGQKISNLLNDLREKATQARDPSITTPQRAAYNADFVQLRDAIVRTLENAEFNGLNMIEATGDNVTAFADDSGGSIITITAVSFALSGAVITLASNATLSSATAAAGVLSAVLTSITNVNLQLASLGAAAKGIEEHKDFVTKLSDSLENGVGNLVDADLAKEGARLQALQVKQQLGAQAVSIANQSPRILLSFFQ